MQESASSEDTSKLEQFHTVVLIPTTVFGQVNTGCLHLSQEEKVETDKTDVMSLLNMTLNNLPEQ